MHRTLDSLSPPDAEVVTFRTQGFLIIEELLTAEELEGMRQRADDIARPGFDPAPTIGRQVEPAVASGEEDADSFELSLRKMKGLALAHDPMFEAHARRPRILELVAELLGPDLIVYQDQLFMKPPRVGSRQPYHQDQPAGFHIDPPDFLVTCWTALDDSTEDNGCLRYVLGSHRLGPLGRDQLDEVETKAQAGHLAQEVPLVVPAGGCGIHHGWLLHASDVNLSERRRRGYAVHYVSSRCRYTGPEPKPPFLHVSGKRFSACI